MLTFFAMARVERALASSEKSTFCILLPDCIVSLVYAIQSPPLTSIATVAVALILAGLTLLAGLASLTVLALASLACLAFLTGLAIDAVPAVIYLCVIGR